MSDEDVEVGDPVYLVEYFVGDPVEIAGSVSSAGHIPDVSEVNTIVNDALTVHIIDPSPHPEYDDIPSLVLLFENRLV